MSEKRLPWMVMLAAVHAAGCAQAIDSKLKVGLETPVVVFGRTVLQSSDPDVDDRRGTEFAIGIAPPARTTYLAFGWPTPVGVDVAYGLSDHFVLGARTGIGFSTVEGDDVFLGSSSSLDMLAFSLQPHLDYVFISGHVKPFVGIEAGVTHVRSASDNASGRATLWNGGATAGVHAFVAQSLSIDPRLSIGYGFGSYSQEQTVTFQDAGSFDFVLDQDIKRIDVVLRLGMSGWF